MNCAKSNAGWLQEKFTVTEEEYFFVTCICCINVYQWYISCIGMPQFMLLSLKMHLYLVSFFRVIESKHADYAVGDIVHGFFGWCSHSISNGDPSAHPHGLSKLDPKSTLSPSTALGILGMPG